MHTGIISFCDRIGFNIKSSDVKDIILAELEAKYNIRILQKHWYRLDSTSASHLDRSPHYACLRSNGNPYFMFLTKYEDTNIIFFVDKKVQPGYEKPRIILGKGRFDDSLFEGTIFDGEMVKDADGNWIFLINDLVASCGRMLYHLILPARLQAAYDILQHKYHPDDLMDVCLFQVKRYFPCAASVMDELVEFSQSLPYTNRGIYFWPQSLKFKPKLYNFNDDLIKTVFRKVKDNPEFKTIVPATPATITTQSHEITNAPSPAPTPALAPQASRTCMHHEGVGEDEKVLMLRKTENPDVYDIYENNAKIGIAHVATLKTSKMLRSCFKDLTVAVSIAFVCKYQKEVDKWEPMRQHAV